MFRLFVLFLAAMIFLSAYDVVAEFTDEDTATRHIGIGTSGGGSTNSLSFVGIVPFKEGKYTGWVGGFAQQISEGDEIQAQTVNVHAEGEIEFTELLGVTVFGDVLRDRFRGIDRQLQGGFFVSADVIEEDGFDVTVGLGNYVQDKQAREDLELTELDPTTVHLLAYAKTSYRNVSVVWRFTPELDLTNPHVEARPKASWQVSDKWGVTVGGIVGFEDEALVDDERLYYSYQLQGTYSF